MARYYRSDSGAQSIYKVDGGIHFWTGAEWVSAPRSVYDDFAEGALDYDEISEWEASLTAKV